VRKTPEGLYYEAVSQNQPMIIEYPTDNLRQKYQISCNKKSDINEHVPTLCNLAMQCPRVVEIGLRKMISSWGFLMGLSKNSSSKRFYLGIDIAPPPIAILFSAQVIANENGIPFEFWLENDMNVEIPQTDLLFIDSLHTYCHLIYELETFCIKVDKYIAIHDTSSPYGQKNEKYTGDYSEYPPWIDKNKQGLEIAVKDFLSRHPEWMMHKKYSNCHGLTILKRVH